MPTACAIAPAPSVCATPDAASSDKFCTPPVPTNEKTKSRNSYDECKRRLRMDNLDDIGFEASAKTTDKKFWVTSPEKFDGSSGRMYCLGSDRFKNRVQELDKNNIVKCEKVTAFKGIGYTPPKHFHRSDRDDQSVNPSTDVVADNTSTDVSAVAPAPKPKSRGVYVPVVDPFMMGSTDYSEAMKFVESVVCGNKLDDGTACAGRLHDLRIPNSGTGGALCFKCFCTSCGKEFQWGPDITPPRGPDGKFLPPTSNSSRFCSAGDRLLYSVSS